MKGCNARLNVHVPAYTLFLLRRKPDFCLVLSQNSAQASSLPEALCLFSCCYSSLPFAQPKTQSLVIVRQLAWNLDGTGSSLTVLIPKIGLEILADR